MNEIAVSLGISAWKPVATALLLPPIPWIVMIVWGAARLRQHRPAGWLLVACACLGLWLGATSAMGEVLARALLTPPPALGAAEISRLRQSAATRPGEAAIVVLGGGRQALAPEYGVSNLVPRSMERLRYGLWLGRETGLPVAFAGGVGHAASNGTPEAEIAARIAAQDFNRPLKWQEARSRDTRENASFTVGMLRPQRVMHIVVVTHGWHMPRAMRDFEEAVRNSGGGMTVTAAPMGLAQPTGSTWLRWLPSNDGQDRVRHVLHEWLGRLAGA